MHIRWKITLTSGYALDDGHSILWVSVDDVRICRPQNFDRKWCSLKFRAAALRYEVGISVSSGEIAWVIGPFPAGKKSIKRSCTEKCSTAYWIMKSSCWWRVLRAKNSAWINCKWWTRLLFTTTTGISWANKRAFEDIVVSHQQMEAFDSRVLPMFLYRSYCSANRIKMSLVKMNRVGCMQ